jgi:pimeloyl-ACP methyl ester carboxylesterase
VLRLESAGFRVVRFDNRDAGYSGDGPVGYTIQDMAEDTYALAVELGFERIHLVGISMGGLITQELSLRHPELVASQVLLHTMPSNEFLASDPEILATRTMRSDRPMERDEAVEAYIRQELIAGITGLGLDWLRHLAEEQFDRAYRPDGATRQNAAVLAYGDRREALRATEVVTTIAHGQDDRLITMRAALAAYEVFPNAALHIWRGIGHEVAPGIWSDLEAILRHNVADTAILKHRMIRAVND